MAKKEFLKVKEKVLKSLEEACSEDKTDQKIIPILNIINSLEYCYTTSSCSGRTVLLEIPKIGDKKAAKFLGKWHEIIKISDIKKASDKAEKGLIWILAQSPVIHIRCTDINIADKLLKTAVSSGFKHSGLKSSRRKIVIEVCSTERLDAPIGRDGNLFCNEEYLQLLVDISNEIFQASNIKISQFEVNLRQNFV